jgi:hypothetical protein
MVDHPSTVISFLLQKDPTGEHAGGADQPDQSEVLAGLKGMHKEAVVVERGNLVQTNTFRGLRLVGSDGRPVMSRATPVRKTMRRRDPPITGRLPEEEKREMKAEFARRGIDVEDWVAYACQLAFKGKNYPKKEED